jgi:hypothetical protein
MLEKRVVKKTFLSDWEDETERWRKFYDEKIHKLLFGDEIEKGGGE